MSGTDDVDTSRSVVKTYVPAYQKELWQEHADRLGMNQSEFVRTMVQAGRRGFGPVDHQSNGTDEPAGDGQTTPGDDDLVDAVVGFLDERGPMGWDELVDVLAEDFENRLDDALESLQDENRVKHSGRDGGYRLVDGS